MNRKRNRRRTHPKLNQIGLRPKETPPELNTTVQGGEVIEAFLLAKNPDGRKADKLLLRAKRFAKYSKANHLKDHELRAVSWFAHVPQFSGDLHGVVFDPHNFYASSFWEVWQREPETVLRLAGQIRKRAILNQTAKHKDVEDVISQPKKYSSSSQPRLKKATQRARKMLKPPENISKFAARLRGEKRTF